MKLAAHVREAGGRHVAALLTSLLAPGLLAGTAAAQTLYAFDPPAGRVHQLAGPPSGPCLYPNGPILDTFLVGGSFACPTVQPGAGGAIAVNKATDTIWVTDGLNVTEYTPKGATLSSFGVGTLAPVGMAWDSTSSVLWLTDGFQIAGLAAVPSSGCAGPPPIATPPFVPAAFSGSPITDLTWDQATGSLFYCDMAGMVSNVLPGGAAGPFAPIAAAPGPCGLTAPLLGITIDTARPTTTPTYYVHDGTSAAYLLATGTTAAGQFYTPEPCFALPATLDGVAFAAHGTPYGMGAIVDNPLIPRIGSIGQSIPGGPGFVITLDNAPPGWVALLFGGCGVNGPFCPAPLIASLQLFGDPQQSLGIEFTDPQGTASTPIPLPPIFPAGTPCVAQWVVFAPLPASPEGPPIGIGPGISGGMGFSGSRF